MLSGDAGNCAAEGRQHEAPRNNNHPRGAQEEGEPGVTLPWNTSSSGARVVAIGDIHGDLDALVRIVLGMQLIDHSGHWCGGTARLVLLGDLNDRGPDSVAVMTFVMRLEREARAVGGNVDALVGNHEILAAAGDFRYVRGREALAVEHYWAGRLNGLEAIFRGDSPWAAWIRSRPTFLRIDSTLFVHAGLGVWAETTDPASTNLVVQRWLGHLQTNTEPADTATEWLIEQSGNGPMWTRAFEIGPKGTDRETVRPEDLDRWLARLEAERVVVGHTPTKAIDHLVGHPHPEFGDAVAVADTGISAWYGGRLSAIEITGGHLEPRYFARGDEPLELTDALGRESKTLLAE